VNLESFAPFIKQALGNSLKTGATQMVEEMAETFSADDIDRLIGVLQKVAKRKRGTIDTTGK
jgi:hypothetical protein